ncbi:hypothetical protein AX17_005798 [Amanita inopinata Kibby_2008]|nr:hypothetical protein AX17_005798 [Amanita inopinata Kibby_2008]
MNPSASLSSPTETHAAASGVFRSSGSPPWHLEECEIDSSLSDLNIDEEEEEAIEIDETFTKHNRFPGSVKIVVETTTFWAHKEVLYFASPFFQAALSGNWSETGRLQTTSSIVPAPHPPNLYNHTAKVATGDELLDFYEDGDENVVAERDDTVHATDQLQKGDSENRQRKIKPPDSNRFSPAQATVRKCLKDGPDAVIVLKEEKASIFHDMLKFIYPHLECTITWNNVEGLMNISHKLCVPPLQRECLTFLLTHAAGKPIKALRIAELFEEEELYREASRFVLDNPGGWSEHELNTLSKETLLKLEKRRNWFLERVLKLGLTMIAKEYQCCPTCCDTSACARLLEEKWRQAYHAVFRFGPPQPSMVFRYLRMLEGVSPPLSLTQTACQASAKAFTATLFDRMFSLGIRGGGIEGNSLGSRGVAAAVPGSTNGPRRHFLYCSLKSDVPMHKARRSRDVS